MTEPRNGQPDETPRDPKKLRLRYAGKCVACGAALPKGAEALYQAESKTVRCIECARAVPSSGSPATAASEEELERYMPPVRREHLRLAREARARATAERRYWTPGGVERGEAAPTIPASQPEDSQRYRPVAAEERPTEPTSINPGTAGASARAEFQRRRDRDRERLRSVRPALLAFGLAMAMIGLLLTAFGPTPPGPAGAPARVVYFFIVIAAVVMTPAAMFALPASTIAWRTGAIGEERTGELLLPLEAAGFRILHDRVIPRSRANIDHIVVGPPGVYIVETKNYKYKLSRRRKKEFAAQAKREAAAVAAVVAPLAVTPLVCVHRADLGWFKVVVDGVRFVSPRELIKLLRKAPVQLAPEDVTQIARQIDLALKLQGR